MPTYPHTKIEKRAWEFAKEYHRGTLRKFQSTSYFEGHVAKVFGLVKQFDTNPEMGAASLLHDCIEDTSATYDQIKSIFGERVANLVKELTSDEELLTVMGKKDYLLDKMTTMSEDALTIKLCDRLQNISDAFMAQEPFRKKYYLETIYIMNGLKSNRQLNVKHRRVVEQIDGKLNSIKSVSKYNEGLKHIKLFEELYKDTYMSAVDKLRKKNHNTRANKIEDYVDTIGKTSPDKIHVSSFLIKIKSKIQSKNQEYKKRKNKKINYINREFYITDSDCVYNELGDSIKIQILTKLKSKLGENINVVFVITSLFKNTKSWSTKLGKFEIVKTPDVISNFKFLYYNPGDYVGANIYNPIGEIRYEHLNEFSFNNRRDAYEFRKFLLEEYSEYKSLISKIDINDLYSDLFKIEFQTDNYLHGDGKYFESFKVNNIEINDIVKCIESNGVVYATIIKNFPNNDPKNQLNPVSVDEDGLVTIEFEGHNYEVDIKNIERIEY